MDGMDPGMGNMQDKLADYLWQMCFLAHGSAAFETGRKCLGKSELACRLIGLHYFCVTDEATGASESLACLSCALRSEFVYASFSGLIDNGFPGH